jgi:hypothetical protein
VTPGSGRNARLPNYEPDEELIRRYSLKYRWDPARLRGVLVQFGRLPTDGQEKLIDCLLEVLGRYERLGRKFIRITPKLQSKNLRAIKTKTKQLLRLLGFNVKNTMLWMFELDRPPTEAVWSVGNQSPEGLAITGLLLSAGTKTQDRCPVTIDAELNKANERFAHAAIALMWLHEQAKAAAELAESRVVAGHGGRRNETKQASRLVLDALTVYAHMREHYPDSGKKPGFGEPICKFVRAISEMFESDPQLVVTNAKIKECWRKWNSNQK